MSLQQRVQQSVQQSEQQRVAVLMQSRLPAQRSHRASQFRVSDAGCVKLNSKQLITRAFTWSFFARSCSGHVCGSRALILRLLSMIALVYEPFYIFKRG